MFRYIYNKLQFIVRKINKNRIIRLIKKSLLCNMIIMFLIIMLFLKVIFLIAPKEGSISYSGSIIDTAEIECECINSNVISDIATIEFDSKDEIFLEWLQLLLIPTGDSPKVYIESIDNKPFRAMIFTPSGIFDGTQINSPNLLSTFPHVNVTFNYWDTLINSKTGFTFDVEDDTHLILTFSQIDAYVRNELGEIEKVDSFETTFFDCASYESTLRLSTDYYYYDVIDSPTEYKISFVNPNKIQFVANDDFYVSYSSRENKFSSTMRKIELHSNGKMNGYMEYRNDNIDLNVYGHVNEGTIDGYSIFPTFSSWYYENIYIAPLTIISTLIGGIALMKKEIESD